MEKMHKRDDLKHDLSQFLFRKYVWCSETRINAFPRRLELLRKDPVFICIPYLQQRLETRFPRKRVQNSQCMMDLPAHAIRALTSADLIANLCIHARVRTTR